MKDFLVMKSSKIVLDPTPWSWVREGSKGFCIDFRVAVTETLGTEIKRLGEGHDSDCRMENSVLWGMGVMGHLGWRILGKCQLCPPGMGGEWALLSG